MLKRFKEAKEEEISKLRELQNKGIFPKAFVGKRPDFISAICRNPFTVIAEYKRASPSKGIIRQEFEVEDVVKGYINAGAAAISILTEEKWFQGNFSFLDRANAVINETPILRKDFIFDPLQIRATAASRASAVLLIVRATPDISLLKDMQDEAKSFGLACVVEIFDQSDLEIARKSGAKIIQVNARDLSNLSINREQCLNLIKNYPPIKGEIWIAASGINTAMHLQAVKNAGFNSALIGSFLMEKGIPGDNLLSLLEELKNAG